MLILQGHRFVYEFLRTTPGREYMALLCQILDECELEARTRTARGAAIDPLAATYAVEARILLELTEPKLSAAKDALEFAAARDPELYAQPYELLRDLVMNCLVRSAPQPAPDRELHS